MGLIRRRLAVVWVVGALVMGAAACGGGVSDRSATTSTVPASCGGASASAGTTDHTLDYAGLERQYRLTVFPGYDGRTPAPLIVNLHGFSSSAAQQDEQTDLPAQAGARGYVVVTPQGAPINVSSDVAAAGGAAGAQQLSGVPFWNFFGSSGADFGSGATIPVDVSSLGTDDVGFIDTLIDTVADQLCIDRARVYATGVSNGAGMSVTLACELGDRFAAIAAVAGVNLSGACPGDTPMSVLAIHGRDDTTVPLAGGTLMGYQLGNPSVADRMQAWADRDRCSPPEGTVTETGPVEEHQWTGCADGTDVELLVVADMRHEWPRATTPDQPPHVDATKIVLDFFDAHAT